jgi:hypothetical protein
LADFLRPAARAALWRWREVLSGLAVAGLGLWWAITAYAIMRWLGFALVAGGLALVWTGWQRLRFARGGGGAGVVQIDERRLAYFGPLTGGVIDLDDLSRLVLDPTGHPTHWLLTAKGGNSLSIPVNAEGADQLFDLFAALPGIRTERMLDLLARAPTTRVTVWAADKVALPTPDRPRLH